MRLKWMQNICVFLLFKGQLVKWIVIVLVDYWSILFMGKNVLWLK